MKVGELRIIIGPAVIEARDIELPDLPSINIDKDGAQGLIDGLQTFAERLGFAVATGIPK